MKRGRVLAFDLHRLKSKALSVKICLKEFGAFFIPQSPHARFRSKGKNFLINRAGEFQIAGKRGFEIFVLDESVLCFKFLRQSRLRLILNLWFYFTTRKVE